MYRGIDAVSSRYARTLGGNRTIAEVRRGGKGWGKEGQWRGGVGVGDEDQGGSSGCLRLWQQQQPLASRQQQQQQQP
jgi:hypothetical protein